MSSLLSPRKTSRCNFVKFKNGPKAPLLNASSINRGGSLESQEHKVPPISTRTKSYCVFLVLDLIGSRYVICPGLNNSLKRPEFGMCTSVSLPERFTTPEKRDVLMRNCALISLVLYFNLLNLF